MFLVKDRVQETCNSPLTGSISLLGAVSGFQTFSSAIGNSNTTFYTIADQSGTNWEVGVGTYSTTGNALARTTVLASSNAGALVNFSNGTQNVWCDYAAGKSILLDPLGKLNAGGNGYLDYASSSPAVAAGRMWYDDTTGSWNLGMGGGSVTQQIGENLYIYGKATANIVHNPLKIVYKTGVVGASSAITFAPSIAGITDDKLILGVAAENIGLNSFGRVTSFGLIKGIATNGSAYGETWQDNQTIWYNPITGNPTKYEPLAPNIKCQIGNVISAGAGGSGSFYVEVIHSNKLGVTNSDVAINNPTEGQLLQYNGARWDNVNKNLVSDPVGTAYFMSIVMG